jgi:glucuronate isomerase
MTPSLFDEDFLLETTTARDLYHGHAKSQPIIDYHCHLPPELIRNNHRFASLTELWLKGDHYKWRAMRTQGVPEKYCTGEASDWEKFAAWASTVPHTLRNPLYHWTHLELKNPFGIRRLLDPSSAREIYQEANRQLAGDSLTTQGILRNFRVVVLCTTDDPTDTLEHHVAYAKTEAARHTRVYPAWRPDRGLGVEDPESFNPWVDRLAAMAGLEIRGFDDLLAALARRHDDFHRQGCRLSDYGTETAYAEDYNLSEVRAAFDRARRGEPVLGTPALKYKSALMYEFSLMDQRAGWTQQLHLGALRNNSSRMRAMLGPDTGFDSIGDFEIARPLARFLDRLDRTNQLAKTILYNLNPRDNELMATMIGNFQDGSVPGKLQYGSAWWFLDQLDGMEKQLNALSNMGLLSRFVGMLTDSRSFLSYSRHEYFRRLVCNLLGQDVRRGLVPNDPALLGALVEDLCFRNARAYFGLPLPDGFVEAESSAA